MMKNNKRFWMLWFILPMVLMGVVLLCYFVNQGKTTKLEMVKSMPSPKKVIIYSASWCNSCEVAKRYMSEEKIAFEERDVEKNQHYQTEWQALNSPGIPVLLIGNSKLEGFDLEEFQKTLQKEHVVEQSYAVE